MPEPSATRLFVAVRIDAPAYASVLATLDRLRADAGAGSIRWVRPEGLHVTLAFIGEVAHGAVPRALAAVAGAWSTPSARICLELQPVAVAPSPSRPRTVWIPVVDHGGAAGRLSDAVHSRLREQGMPTSHERFRPHVTLGRARRDCGPYLLPPDHHPAASRPRSSETGWRTGPLPARWSPSEIEVWSSELGPGGSRYRTVAAFTLP